MTPRTQQQQAPGIDTNAGPLPLQKLFTQAAIGIGYSDLEDRVLDINPFFCAALGYERSELIGRTLDDLSDPSDRAKDLELADELLNGKRQSYTMEKRYQRKDGSYFWGRLNVSLARDETGAPRFFIGILEDITAAKQTEAKLSAERELAKTLIDTVPVIVLRLSPQGAIQQVNPYFETLTGYREDEIRGKDWITTFLPKHERERIQALLGTAVQGKSTLGNVNPILTRSGEERQIAWSDTVVRDGEGRTISLLAIGLDITEWQTAAAAVEAEKLRLHRVINAMFGHVGILDLDGRLVEFNQAPVTGERAAGYSTEDVAALPFWDLPSWDQTETRAQVQDAFRAALRGETTRFVAPLRARDGHRMFRDLAISPLPDATGKITNVIAYAVDITERHEHEQRSQRLLAIIGSAPDLIATADTAGNLTYLNDAGRAALEVGPADDLTALHISQFHRPGVAEFLLRQALPQAAAEGYWEGETEFRRRDGSLYFASQTIVAHRDTNGAVDWFSTVARDITERKRAEALLEVARQHTESILGSIADGFFTLDNEWVYTYINEEAAQLVGKSAAQLINRRIWDLFPEAEGSLWHQRYEQVRRSREPLFFVDYYAPLDRWYETSVYPFEGGISVYFRDATEEKMIEEAQRESETRLREAQRIAQIGSWDLDLVGGALTWSDEIYRIFEIDAAQFGASYEAFLATIHPEDREMVNLAYTESVANKTPYEISHRLRMPDGRIKWVTERCRTLYDDAAKPIRSSGTVQDITDNKKAEDALRASEARLRAIVDSEPECVKILDENCRLLEINPAGLRLIEAVSLDDVLGCNILDLIVPSYRELYLDGVAAVFRGESLMQEFEITGLKGARRVMEQHAAPLFDPAQPGKVTAMLAVTRDITGRKSAEVALRKSLNEKEMLLREVHHRVKNNLQIISSLLYFQNKKARNATDAGILTDVRDRLRAMILVHEKLYQSTNLTRVDFAAYIRSLVNELANSLAPSNPLIEMRVEAAPCSLPIEVALPCGMIVCELVTNAFKYAFPGGATGRLSVSVAPVDRRVIITVSDNGVGMPAGFVAEKAASFGWQLIGNLSTQIGGAITLSDAGGTAVTISLPDREEDR